MNMNTLPGGSRLAIVDKIALASTPAELCKAANANALPAVFTNMYSPDAMARWKDEADKRNYFNAAARLLDCRKGNAFLVHGSAREAETAHKIFAEYGVSLDQFPYIISPAGTILPRPGVQTDLAQCAKGASLARGMIAGASVILVGGLLRSEHVLNTMRDILRIASGMGRKPGDFSVMTHPLITRDALGISPSGSHRDWENPEGR